MRGASAFRPQKGFCESGASRGVFRGGLEPPMGRWKGRRTTALNICSQDRLHVTPVPGRAPIPRIATWPRPTAGKGAFESEGLPSDGVPDCESPGEKRHLGLIQRRGSSVSDVADNGMAAGGQLRSDLVASSRFEDDRQEAAVLRGRQETVSQPRLFPPWGRIEPDPRGSFVGTLEVMNEPAGGLLGTSFDHR